MTLLEFKTQYAKSSGMTVGQFDDLMVVRPCKCGDASCFGWQAVSRKFTEAFPNER